MTAVHEIIVLFSKYPVAGRSKTRLIPVLGAVEAAALQRRMTEAMVEKIERFRRRSRQYQGRRYAFEIHHDGGTREEMRAWLGSGHSYRRQVGGDLGRRMHSVISSHLGRYRSVILVGSDCPALDEAVLASASHALAQADVVLGPAYDGGYYLVGVRSALAPGPLEALFTDIPWGSDEVLAATLARTQEHDLNCRLLKKLHDIDTPDDLSHLDHYPDP